MPPWAPRRWTLSSTVSTPSSARSVANRKIELPLLVCRGDDKIAEKAGPQEGKGALSCDHLLADQALPAMARGAASKAGGRAARTSSTSDGTHAPGRGRTAEPESGDQRPGPRESLWGLRGHSWHRLRRRARRDRRVPRPERGRQDDDGRDPGGVSLAFGRRGAGARRGPRDGRACLAGSDRRRAAGVGAGAVSDGAAMPRAVRGLLRAAAADRRDAGARGARGEGGRWRGDVVGRPAP